MSKEKLYRTALFLSIFTVVYNLLEGLISVYFGIADETLTLFGFGIDSFIEVISGIGIMHMIIRIQIQPDKETDHFEKRALQITGFAFYFLCIGLTIETILRLIENQQPQSTVAGIIISVFSILIMWALIKMKIKTGEALESAPILADASCTKVCLYMSLILLLSSFIYEFTKIKYIDVLGTAGIIYFSFKEGREAFEKAKGKACCSC